jgi:hypothetical protein
MSLLCVGAAQWKLMRCSVSHSVCGRHAVHLERQAEKKSESIQKISENRFTGKSGAVLLGNEEFLL